MALATVQMLARHLEQMGFRADAGETAQFLRSLLFIEQEVYQTEYVENRARDFIPVDTTVPAWADSFAWRIWGLARYMAKIVTRYSDDLPAVDVMAAELLQKVQTIADSFGYSIQDLRAACEEQYEPRHGEGELARQAQENLVEVIAAFRRRRDGAPLGS